jgi:hypothetical protein
MDRFNLYNPTGDISMASVLFDGTNYQRVNPVNAFTAFRDAFEVFTPGADKWTVSQAAGDLLIVDGNTASASWLDFSLDPLSAGTESEIIANASFEMPLEGSFGISMSQRTLGQEFAIEIVELENTLAPELPLQIGFITQSGTTLTVNTVLPHGLVPGKCIGINSVRDSRLNYPSLVVATIPTSTQFTVTAGPGGTIPSVTSLSTSGFVFRRKRMGLAPNGTSFIFENATATNASIYLRSEAGDALPSGTIAGNQSVTINSSASVAAVTAANAYAFQPTTEYRCTFEPFKIQWSDIAIDAITQTTNRLTRNQVVPDTSVTYGLRIRGTNNPSLSIPVGYIGVATKNNSTTALVTTLAPHGLTTSDVVTAYGTRDQTNFANLTAATGITSILSPTQFSLTWGSATTAFTQSGVVVRVNGGNLPSALGYIGQVIQSISRTSDILTVTGNATWTGLVIGDYVNIVNVLDTNGVSLGLDGTYRVANFVTSALTLEPIGSAPTGENIVTTNCGGAVIKRTSLRLSFVRIFDYDRQRVEMLPRPTSDIANSVPMVIQGGTLPAVTTVSTVTTVTTVTTVNSVTSANLAIPGIIADVASAGINSSVTVTAAFTPTFGVSYEVNVGVTTITGGGAVYELGIEESDDTGTNWFRVYDFPRISTSGVFRSPKLNLTGNRIRYAQSVLGVGTFTRSINRLQSSDAVDMIRQGISRSINLLGVGATTPSVLATNCRNAQLQVNVGAASVAPTIVLEGSDDFGVSWYQIGAGVTAVASSTVQATYPVIQSGLLRARVAIPGSGVTTGYVLVKGF